MSGKILTQIRGRSLGLSHVGNLAANGYEVTRQAVSATVTVGDEAANVRTINITLLNAKGKAIDEIEWFRIHIIDSGDGTSLGTPSPSTGLAIGTDGALRTVVSNAEYLATTEAGGTWDGTWTDTGTATAFIAVELPSGQIIYGDQALTNA